MTLPHDSVTGYPVTGSPRVVRGNLPCLPIRVSHDPSPPHFYLVGTFQFFSDVHIRFVDTIILKVWQKNMTFVETAKQMLLDGRDGRDVVHFLKSAFVAPEQAKGTERTISSLHSVMTLVRRAVAESDGLPCDAVRLPSTRSMDTFKLTRDEIIQLKANQEASWIHKADNVLVVAQFDKLLKTVRALLDTARPEHSNARLILPLLISSGRRLSEICNGRSTFAPTDRPFACLFGGQLKRKGTDSASYVIPLLVPYSSFANGMAAFRQKQVAVTSDKRRAKTTVATLTNAQVKTRYQFPLQCALAKNGVVSLPKCHIHDLRALYAAAVWELYECRPQAFNRVLMRVLGHCISKDSLSYIHVQLDDVESLRHTFGPLPGPVVSAPENAA